MNGGEDECFKTAYVYPNFQVTCLVPCIINGVLYSANTLVFNKKYNVIDTMMALIQ